VLACESGDAAGWNDLVERYSPTVRSAARSAAGSEDAADDVAQSIWLSCTACVFARTARPPASWLTILVVDHCGWLRAVVAQLAVDQHGNSRALCRLRRTAILIVWATS